MASISASITSRLSSSISYSTNFQYENVVLCKIEGKKDHILKNPKILPCGNTGISNNNNILFVVLI